MANALCSDRIVEAIPVNNLYWQRADGTGGVQRLTESQNPQYPASWHPSGKFLAFTENPIQRVGATGSDVWILPMEGDETSGWKPGKPTVFLNGLFAEDEPMFSPDGRWLAYSSNESGRFEVYVRPFPGPGGRWLISTSGGIFPTWSRKRSELFYSNTELWSEAHFTPRPRQRGFDVHPDGDRFALAPFVEPTTTRQDKVVFIFNFFDELRRIAPSTK